MKKEAFELETKIDSLLNATLFQRMMNQFIGKTIIGEFQKTHEHETYVEWVIVHFQMEQINDTDVVEFPEIFRNRLKTIESQIEVLLQNRQKSRWFRFWNKQPTRTEMGYGDGTKGICAIGNLTIPTAWVIGNGNLSSLEKMIPNLRIAIAELDQMSVPCRLRHWVKSKLQSLIGSYNEYQNKMNNYWRRNSDKIINGIIIGIVSTTGAALLIWLAIKFYNHLQ